MGLTEDLENRSQAVFANLSATIKARMKEATEELHSSGIIQQACQQGDMAPDFSLPNTMGKTITLSELLQSGPVVLSFYRGQWCTFCNLELQALERISPTLRDLGATLVAISPQTFENSSHMVAKHELTFNVLSDRHNSVARSYGLVFRLPESLRVIYQRLDIDLPAYNGDQTFELPIPATYVIRQNGQVALSFVNADYTQRLDPRDIIKMLRSLKNGQF
ncbi:peroxiredoxin-like family protein [Roseofilum capinflatum]|uniref:thioredoxin-dependent peroxiredoxin n=1 Tax=Roseofilum capinflatum BLCC-M114 TaxID=3022440 RepID=A0ABT7B499_9CYAN|nr:peroxiredoxin-like family protein [Roseofilum capinflatum]MDJ1174001.1 peroxiredoxin-like family protein [Roseofilum capinflatum BLCC-M114]MDJ1177066.1 peroxiredoxin-like family protein [Roseofilum capinflatum BLCC-M114]